MEFGIFLFPHLFKKDFDVEKHLEMVCRNDVKLVYTNLISFSPENEEQINNFKKMTSVANRLGMKVYADINRKVLDAFGISQEDREAILKFFVDDLQLAGIRLDAGIGGDGVAKFSNNNRDAKVILNATDSSDELGYIISLGANKNNLYSAWNFYPQRYTASTVEHFEDRLKYIHSFGVKMQAFLSIQHDGVEGPWAYVDKLPSLEMHRDADINFQLRHFIAMGVDEVYISTQYATQEDLNEFKNLDTHRVTFKIKPARELQDNEKIILLDSDIHCVRKDLAACMKRSTLPRAKYKGKTIEPDNNKKEFFEPGDVVILNNKAMNYEGELHIITEQIKNDGIRNFIGHLDNQEFFLTRYLTASREFRFEINK